jgi:quercetin dioxygenase-like cupin family protein
MSTSIEGELELTIDGVSQIVRPGVVGIVPGNVRHSVKAHRRTSLSSSTIR